VPIARIFDVEDLAGVPSGEEAPRTTKEAGHVGA
jgi:hypothetical protein